METGQCQLRNGGSVNSATAAVSTSSAQTESKHSPQKSGEGAGARQEA